MSQQLSTFTSIITLLSLKCPEIKQQMECLRQAVTQWNKQVQEKILSKNRAIMAAKTRGTQKLFILFKQLDNFFDNLMKNYNDPNMPIFYTIFLKIKEDFEFIDIDFDKFKQKQKYTTTETQTDKQNNYMYGLDSQKLIKSFEDKQYQLQLVNKKNEDFDHQNKILKNEIEQLIMRLRREEAQHEQKINELKTLLQKMRAEAKQSMRQTQKKQNGGSLLHNQQTLTKRKIMSDLINLQIVDVITTPQKKQDQTSIQEVNSISKGPELLRFIFSQAVTIQQFLQNHRANENPNQS